MSNTPDDGGPSGLPYITAEARVAELEAQLELMLEDRRYEAAVKLAAAWLPIVTAAVVDCSDELAALVSEVANKRGLAMADNLIRRMREHT